MRMQRYWDLARFAAHVAPIVAVLMSLASSAPVLAGAFVYVSNADDGEIGTYTLQRDGSLKPGQHARAEKIVMPMAVSPDKRFLIAAVRSKPYQAYSYSIDRGSGELKLVGNGTLAESFPYISFDRSGRFLFGASYGANLVSVNPVGADGRVGDPPQVVPTARNAHSIRVDNSNRFVFAPHLGTDQIFQFVFDEKTGRLTANTPPVLQLKQGTGPRHLVISQDNRFIYLLNELTGTVTALALDPSAGLLKELHTSSLSCLRTPSSSPACRAARLARPARTRHPATLITTSGLRIFTSLRTAGFSTPPSARPSTLAAFRVDTASGKLTYLGSTPTEKQPRGFNIDPTGRFIVIPASSATCSTRSTLRPAR